MSVEEYINNARNLLEQDKIDDAIKMYEKSLELANNSGNTKVYADVCLEFGTLLVNLENYEDAEKLFKEAYKHYKNLNIKNDLANSMYNLALALYNLGKYDEALKYISEAEALFKDVGSADGYADAIYVKALIYSALGDYDKALATFKETLNAYKKVGNVDAMISVYIDMANMAVDAEEEKDAITYLKKAKELAIKKGDPATIGDVMVAYGEIYEALEKYPKACESFLDAAENYANAGMPELAKEYLGRVDSLLDELPKATQKRIRNRLWDLEDALEKKK